MRKKKKKKNNKLDPGNVIAGTFVGDASATQGKVIAGTFAEFTPVNPNIVI